MSQFVGDRTAAKSGAIGRVSNIVLWVLQVGAAAVFLMAGFSKLAGAEQMVAKFDVIGAGQWFRYATGALEVLGALGLLIPRLNVIGAVLLGGVMSGAVLTHLFVIGDSPAVPIVLLAVIAIITWGRREKTARWVKR